MDYKKLLFDVFTLNLKDLKKRTSKLNRLSKRIIHKKRNKLPSADEIPVLINNRNRLTYLKNLISSLENIGCKNIYIIDNDSTYPPLLEYYKQLKHTIIFLSRNAGPQAIWNANETKTFLNDYYIYTDSDVVPESSVTIEIINDMMNTLNQNITLEKIGLGLRIDDLPDHYKMKEQVIQWESKFNKNIVDEKYFSAPVDTTFALYAPYQQGGGECKAYRTRAPYLAKHMPWYEESLNPGNENLFYLENSIPEASHWTRQNK